MSLSGSKQTDDTGLDRPAGGRECSADGGHVVARSRPIG